MKIKGYSFKKELRKRELTQSKRNAENLISVEDIL